MSYFLNKNRRIRIRYVLIAFVLSWFSLIAQSNAHAFMMYEVQQEVVTSKVTTTCQPILCEAYISHDTQSNHGINSISLIDLNQLTIGLMLMHLDKSNQFSLQYFQSYSLLDFSSPPLQKTSILLI